MSSNTCSKPKQSLVEVRGLLQYHPETGRLTWLVNRPPRGKAGEEAGAVSAGGYRYIYLSGVGYPAIRIAWWLQTGEFPEGEIMLKDGDKTNLKWENLVLRSSLTPEHVSVRFIQESLEYDPSTGNLKWKSRLGMSNTREETAGGIKDRSGRGLVRIGTKLFKKSLICWVIRMGRFPPEGSIIDHKDGDPGNDRWENLRLATAQQNSGNTADWSNRKASSLPRGVVAQGERYRFQLTYKGKRHTIGGFPSAEAAHAAYKKLHQELHGEFSVYASRPQA